MKQVTLEGGAIAVAEVPPPACPPGSVLVRTSHSLISTGTELASTGGGQGLLRQAIANPDLVRKVREKVSTVGLRRTVDLVRARRQSALALGYSAAGQIIEVGSGVTRLRVGDRVACAGAGHANHAEVNAVPQNLAVPVPAGVGFASAACATVGAIALQGVRRLTPTLGEQVVVIGLGLIGQMAAQILRANGVRVLGVDTRTDRVSLARELGMEAGVTPDEGALTSIVQDWTGGIGADAVMLCASGGDAGLLNASLDLCRRKGRVVLVGDVPIRMHRERIYKKELDFLISTSYGPGRYDVEYEEKGLDYPIAYVRWTEGRNLAEVLRLMAERALRVEPLVGRSWPIAEAPQAYASLREGKAIGALLDFALPAAPVLPPRQMVLSSSSAGSGQVQLGVIGVGAFFKGVHHPMLRRHKGFFIKAAAARDGLALKGYASQHDIPVISTDPAAVLRDQDVEAVLIATRHDLHAALVIDALEAGKHVFVEKPMGLTVEECDAIVGTAARTNRMVMVGFNRRFAPSAVQLKQAFQPVSEPRTLVYRINAGAIPADHWLRDPQQGGGRLVGEGVHFFDFARWFIGSDPVAVSTAALRRGGELDLDNAAVSIEFSDGSTAVILYNAQGASGLGKERIEVFGGGRSGAILDFAGLELYGPGVKGPAKAGAIEKGHFEIVANLHDALRGRAPAGVAAEDGWWATWCARAAYASAAEGRRITRG